MSFVGAFFMAVVMFFTSPAVGGGLPRCGSWFTVSTTAKTYSPCNHTTLGIWHIASSEGCLQYVSWRRTQQSVPYNRAPYRNQRVLLENEVRAQWHIELGPVNYTKTQVMPGSHQTSTIGTSRVYGTSYCTP